MTEYFIADMHFGSGTTAKRRGFASAKAMDEAIKEAWISKVTADDIVWVLGDVGDLSGVQALPGIKHLVFGNDDKPKGAFKDSGLFVTATNSAIHESRYGRMLLVHRPKDAAEDQLPVLHGHTHALPDEPDPRFVSVSVDKTGWGPIDLGEVWRRIALRIA